MSKQTKTPEPVRLQSPARLNLNRKVLIELVILVTALVQLATALAN
jgi:hypothetical protein